MLVILGLLVGGVLEGKALIESTQRKKMMRDAEQLLVMNNAFQEKYFAFPGDVATASQFFGADIENGDGDGQIEKANGADCLTPIGEIYVAWQHLGLAGIAANNVNAGQLTGGSSGWSTDPQKTTYDGQMNYVLQYTNRSRSASNLGDYNNRIMIGKYTTANCGQPNQAAFTPTMMYELDLKYDDGAPTTGGFGAPYISLTSAGGGATIACSNAGSYLLTQTNEACIIVFGK